MCKMMMGLKGFNQEDKYFTPILYMAPNKQRMSDIIIIKLVMIY